MKIKWYLAYPIVFLIYSVYSFTQVDPNLVISSNQLYWQWQQIFWSIGYSNRGISTFIFGFLILILFGFYWRIIRKLIQGKISKKQIYWLIGGSILALFVSYPALSHDIFNYLFNAKMVWMYEANPHIQVAMDYASDPWLQYMHNIHTPAPYGYGWTVISLLPSFLGQNHLKLTMLLFRGLMLISLLSLSWFQMKLASDKMKIWVFVFLLNPLVLIETISNIHNDVVMMMFLLWSLYLLRKAKKSKSKMSIVLAALMFLISVSIKYASVMVLVGFLIYVVVEKLGKRISWGGAQSIAMFLPLLSKRSQRFLPWYLIWSLSFLPMIKESFIRNVLLLFSLTGLLSYILFLYDGEYSSELLLQRSVILFSLPIAYLIYYLLFQRHEAKK